MAYNDHAPGTIGTQTHSNATIYNVRGISQTNSGYLKDIATGANLPVLLRFTTSGTITWGSTSYPPNPGTPLATNFDGYVYFGIGTDSHIQILAGSYVTNTFSNLDPGKHYSFRGGAIRGGPDAYSNRWTKAMLVGAVTYSNAHSIGSITSAQFPADLQANEAAICTGVNLAGDMWDWEDIDPGEDGSFAVICTQYRGAIPDGGPTDGSYGYAISGIRLQESGSTGPIQFTVEPQGQTVVTGDPFNLSVQCRGAPPYFYQWYRGTTLLTEATNDTYSVLSAAMVDAGYYYVIASNLFSRATSSTAQITITNGVPIVITTQPQNTTVPLGQTAIFTVGVEGTQPRYQWFRNSTAIPGATNATLVFANVMQTNHGDTFYVRITNAVSTNLSSPAILSVDTTRQVLFVASTNLNAADQIITNLLAANGFIVVVQDDGTSATSQTNYKALVVISSSVDHSQVVSKFRDVKIPVITWESGLYNSMQFTTNNGAAWQGTLTGQLALNLYDTNHPLAAGLTGINAVYKAAQSFNYGVPGANACVIASVTNGPDYPVIFGYERMALFANGLMQAPARRVGFFLDDNGATNLTSAGSNLFEAAVQWAIGVPDTNSPVGFSRQPANINAREGFTATFSVNVTGAPPYYLQWRKNGTNISGATGRVYTTPPLTPADDQAGFSVFVTNRSLSTALSSNAVLTVLPPDPIVITNQPQSIAISPGALVSFTVGAAGTWPRIQWYKDGTPIPNATNWSYSLTNIAVTNAGQYCATITNRLSTATSRSATLHVFPPMQTLIPQTNLWRYNTNGIDLNSAWRTNDYDDSSWPQGPGVLAAPASEPMPAGAVVRTVLPLRLPNNSNSITTIYFRSSFTLTNDLSDTVLVLSNLVDDGAVVYMNGEEIQRIHMPLNAITFDTLANYTAEVSNNGWSTTNIEVSGLRQGSNTMAVEVHQANRFNTDLVFGQAANLKYRTQSDLSITNQPQSIELQELTSGTISVGVAGSGAFYQWYHDGLPIPGATQSSLPLSSVTEGNGGVYFVVVTNRFTYLVSSNASLTILYDTNPPVILQQPLSQRLGVGQTATFTVSVSSIGYLKYQWQCNGVAIPGASNASLTLSNVQLDLSGNAYSVQASNHAGSVTSSNAVLTVFPLLITRGPFLQNASSNRLQITWRTTSPASTVVEYGRTEALGFFYADPDLTNEHVATLEGLEPGTAYFYRTYSENALGGLRTSNETFRTLTTGGPISFGVIGDTAGPFLSVQPQLAQVLSMMDPDLVVHLGDVVAGGFTEASANLQFFDIFQPSIQKTPYFFCIGNHDLQASPSTGYDDYNATNFLSNFFPPANSPDGRYYSFDHGDVHFVCLFNPWFMSYVFNSDTEQYAWLTNDLAASSKPWKIIFLHAPIFSSGPHARDDYSTNGSSNGIWDMLEMRDMLLPIAVNYGVQIILGSHDHDLERFAPTNGVHSVISGGGGRGLYPPFFPAWGSAQFWRSYNCLNVAVSNETLTIQAVDASGVLFDSMSIQRTLPSPMLYNATWNTPAIGTGSTNDLDGNIAGQVFDLAGAPIYPRAGQFSNLGRVYVNNDSTNLYVGFEQVMIYPNQSVFLFIESPSLDGVTSMAGVGNNMIDPGGQGADGLDCLENLGFTNFYPSVGCILGDEFADGQYRSFTRTNLGLNVGQGVFYLDANLNDVPGTRLQQFNRSPQFTWSGSGNLSEQSADFIQVAIPFAALGGLLPGDTIRVGAVAGHWDYDPVRQTRSLDTSVLGYSLSGSGQSNVVLEGISVRLAGQPAGPVVQITPIPDGRYLISWNAEIGRRYTIEASSAILGFTPLAVPGLPLTAETTNVNFAVTPPANATHFYRVRVDP